MFLYFIKEFDFLFLILEHHSDSENFAVKRIEAQIVDLEQMIRLKLTGFLKHDALEVHPEHKEFEEFWHA